MWARLFRSGTVPLAVPASAVDRRVVVQRSCFTIHGTDERNFEALLLETDLPAREEFGKFLIPRSDAPKWLEELDEPGMSFSTVYPDLSGLTTELKFRFGPKPAHKYVKGKCDEA